MADQTILELNESPLKDVKKGNQTLLSPDIHPSVLKLISFSSRVNAGVHGETHQYYLFSTPLYLLVESGQFCTHHCMAWQLTVSIYLLAFVHAANNG